MSAWLMTEQSLSNISNWFYFENDGHGTFKQCKKLIFEMFPEYEQDKFKDNWDKLFAEELYNLNCYSLEQRYNKKDFEKFRYQEPKTISKIQVLKSVQCWIYQSCEGDAEEKPLFKLMKKIENILLNSIVGDLEEYKKAEWN